MKLFNRIILLSAMNLNFIIPGVNEGSAQSTNQIQQVTSSANGNMRTTIPDSVRNKLKFINTAFENASPLDWKVDSNGVVYVNLIFDHERSSPNKQSGHWYFQVEAEPGSELTMILGPFASIWNGEKSSPVSDKTICLISKEGIQWSAIPTELTSDTLLKFRLHMESDKLFLASVEPYRISDLEKLKAEIKTNPLVEISTIGKTVEGRPLEIIRVGKVDAPYRIFLRARAHSWEPGGNWVVQGLIRSLLQKDAAPYLKKYCVYIMPMANKDGVARGRTRFNMSGMDLNRKWDRPADPYYSPENYAVENWLNKMIKNGKKPHLAIDLHNDAIGKVHVNVPSAENARYIANMKRFVDLLYKYTWFAEGADNGYNPGSIGEGLAKRFGIDACIYEFNYQWIAGLKKVPLGKDWELLGNQLREVFFRYFEE